MHATQEEGRGRGQASVYPCELHMDPSIPVYKQVYPSVPVYKQVWASRFTQAGLM